MNDYRSIERCSFRGTYGIFGKPVKSVSSLKEVPENAPNYLGLKDEIIKIVEILSNQEIRNELNLDSYNKIVIIHRAASLIEWNNEGRHNDTFYIDLSRFERVQDQVCILI